MGRKQLKCVMYMYQFPTVSVIIVCNTYVLIKVKRRKIYCYKLYPQTVLLLYNYLLCVHTFVIDSFSKRQIPYDWESLGSGFFTDTASGVPCFSLVNAVITDSHRLDRKKEKELISHCCGVQEVQYQSSSIW